MKEKGGTTFAQTPATATSQSMPVAAIAIDQVDSTLSTKEIAERLSSEEWCKLNIKKHRLKIFWNWYSR